MSHRQQVWVSRAVVILMHGACLFAIATGVSWSALVVFLLSYIVRGFAITGGYHRYFSHTAYATSRWMQFALAALGCLALQGGPIKWSKEHRHHHRFSDREFDLHSPKWPRFFWAITGFLWAHIGWIMSGKEQSVSGSVDDLEKYPELRWLERWQGLFILLFIGFLYGLGSALGADYGTSGFQMVVWGFFLSTVWTWHVTWFVNSVNHTFGSRRFETNDDSRNNWIVGILALGEGHHNNHHAHPGLARQGLFWWEVDVTYYVLKLFQKCGLIWDVKEPTPEVYATARSLSSFRKGMLARNLDPEAIRARLMECQRILGQASQGIANLRRRLEKLAAAGECVSELKARLTEAAARFTQALSEAEALAYA